MQQTAAAHVPRMHSMPQEQDHKKEDSTVTDIRIQQFLDAARAYLFGLASPHAALASGSATVCRSL
jgi:hypothetical protein